VEVYQQIDNNLPGDLSGDLSLESFTEPARY
jgi:hypothetical protein